MRMSHAMQAAVLAVLVLAFVLSVGCSQPDPPVLVTPFVAKAPLPPPSSQPAVPAGLEPATPTYEQAVLGK